MAKPVYGSTNPSPAESESLQRFGSVVGLAPEKEQLYRELHADVWPEVLATIEAANIRNYSIFRTELAGQVYLLSYFEYIGTSFEEDMAAMKQCPHTRKWWSLTDPCQRRLNGTPAEAQWLPAELVFHAGLAGSE
ncbi:L-rhamnose mutarotase [Pelagicoccus enzymogenes]|uniref:L-rhamnose mutarotase n=1 Tax=Pelagicoccus enzymogenes TaxID=2773457 RepID=UPI00280EDAE7|nr:L-rhamnose mutarotase [Pelagicoccus enzymogenes]MDQ8197901.1 L-rhamnose mutarotase [Pelagicoccus enzymogenes]